MRPFQPWRGRLSPQTQMNNISIFTPPVTVTAAMRSRRYTESNERSCMDVWHRNKDSQVNTHLHTPADTHRHQASCLYTNPVRLRDESSGLDYSTDSPAVSHQGLPVSVFFTQGTVLLILTFKSLSLTSVCCSPDLDFSAGIADGNQFNTRFNIWSIGKTA